MPARRKGGKGARDKTKAQTNLRRPRADAPGPGPREPRRGQHDLPPDSSPDSGQRLINGLSFLAAVTVGELLRSPSQLAQLADKRGVTAAQYAAELQEMIADDSTAGRLLLARMGAAQLVDVDRTEPDVLHLYVENLAAATGLSKPATAAAIRAHARDFRAAAARADRADPLDL